MKKVLFLLLVACTSEDTDPTDSIESDSPSESSQEDPSDTADSQATDTQPEPFALLSRTDPVSPGDVCAWGGSRTVEGLDDGTVSGIARDGVLQLGEIQSSVTSCDTTPPTLSAPSGLSAPTHTPCEVGSRANQEGVQLEQVFPNLAFEKPTTMIREPGAARWWLLEQPGRVRAFSTDNNTATADTLLDITSAVVSGYEPGLLGLAFHPGYPNIPFIYLTYTTDDGISWGHVNVRLSRWTVTNGAIDDTSEQVLIDIEQSLDEHNGGNIAFLNDGTLLFGVGDGGMPDEVAAFDNMSGKFLRIDVNGVDSVRGTNYAIPLDNPTLDPDMPEAWATGFRNPWRWTYDAVDDEVWVGDVGLVTYEEVGRAIKGENHGWPTVEGYDCRVAQYDFVDPNMSCGKSAFREPEYAYTHTDGCAVMMGPVYRGSALPHLVGRPLFADFCLGMIWSLNDQDEREFILDAGINPTAFAVDDAGEVIAMDWWSGTLWKLVPAGPLEFPELLSQTGCMDPSDLTQPADGALPFRPGSALWSQDDIEKHRWFLLPGAQQVFVANNGHWVFPTGTVMFKRFDLLGEPIEMRLLTRQQDGAWAGQSYSYDETGDAVRVDHTITEQITENHTWTFPDRGQCLHCHTYPEGRTLGPTSPQLNTTAWIPDTSVWVNQADAFEDLNLLINAPNPWPRGIPALSDTSASLSDRARGFLHANCSNCHQPGGGGYGGVNFEWTENGPVSETQGCESTVWGNHMALNPAYAINPGSKETSVLWLRLQESDLYRMHPYSKSINQLAVDVVGQWIDGLQDCDDR